MKNLLLNTFQIGFLYKALLHSKDYHFRVLKCIIFYQPLQTMNIPVAIVEDNTDIRQALEQIIEMADGYTLAGSCINGH